MTQIRSRARRVSDERGITGLETAIVMIAFVVVAAVFAFVVLSTGLFSSERAKETVFAGLAKTSGSLEVDGDIYATTNLTQITKLTFDVSLAVAGDSVSLDPSATSNKTVISYQDPQNAISNVTYTTTVISGTPGSYLLQQGSLFEIDIDLTQPAFSAVTLGPNMTFTLELKPPSGSYLVIQRTTPAGMPSSIINLN
jgi:archaeal flagellin FlaB